VLALCASVLVPVSVAGAHDGEATEVTEVEVFNYETRRVRVIPLYAKVEVPDFNYEDREIKTPADPPYTDVNVFNHEDQQVRVAPFEAFRNVYNYEDQQVRVAPFVRTDHVPVYGWVSRLIEGSCRPPHGCQYRTVWAVKSYKAVTTPVYHYETQTVRVKPFAESYEVWNYETQRVRVAPFSERIYNYITRWERVRVAPFSEWIWKEVFNYEDQQVRVKPFYKTVSVDVPRVHDPSEHTCPAGQYINPKPEWIMYPTSYGFDYIKGDFSTWPDQTRFHMYGVPFNWEVQDSHTGCSLPTPVAASKSWVNVFDPLCDLPSNE